MDAFTSNDPNLLNSIPCTSLVDANLLNLECQLQQTDDNASASATSNWYFIPMTGMEALNQPTTALQMQSTDLGIDPVTNSLPVMQSSAIVVKMVPQVSQAMGTGQAVGTFIPLASLPQDFSSHGQVAGPSMMTMPLISPQNIPTSKTPPMVISRKQQRHRESPYKKRRQDQLKQLSRNQFNDVERALTILESILDEKAAAQEPLDVITILANATTRIRNLRDRLEESERRVQRVEMENAFLREQLQRTTTPVFCPPASPNPHDLSFLMPGSLSGDSYFSGGTQTPITPNGNDTEDEALRDPNFDLCRYTVVHESERESADGTTRILETPHDILAQLTSIT